VQTCAKVAQLLILAWTYQVGLINWHKNAPVHPLATYAKGGAAGAIEFMPVDKEDQELWVCDSVGASTNCHPLVINW
jgi:hypothetical protein